MGVEETKAIRELEERVQGDGLKRVKKAVGSNTVKMEVELDRNCSAEQVRIAMANIMGSFLFAVEQICEDEDYQAEFKKIKSYNFKVVPRLEKLDNKIYGNISIKGKEMNIKLDGSHSLSNGDGESISKYFKTIM